ncbi:hypothetical protein Moror_13692 [Moniliophthora roreri MCA 2997]|uniref:BTB domain-containing protein n=2 Tax=Moniliophthora roreri TaxID=221103 RepID=V2X9H7_MONRO|nr:hypothetical protein Moror_13692 [Moniliophthora roreri MCA 2997]
MTDTSGGMLPSCAALDNCPLAVDIILQSSDGQRLGAHTNNLEVYNRAFPTAGSVTHHVEEVVPLSESAATLTLLLKFTHYENIPDISSLELDQLLALADAADKYGNFFALIACKQALHRWEKERPRDALQILPYKLALGDLIGIDDLVRSTMYMSTEIVANLLKRRQDVFMLWAIYKYRFDKAMTTYNSAIYKCKYLKSQYSDQPIGRAARCFLMQLKRIDIPTTTAINNVVDITVESSQDCDVEADAEISRWIDSIQNSVHAFPTWKEVAEENA